jgi:hypothetical protein
MRVAGRWRRALTRTYRLGWLLLASVLGGYLCWVWKEVHADKFKIRGSWIWNDESIFEFQKIDFRFTSDSFFVAQRFINPAKPKEYMPCSQPDHQIYAMGRYSLKRDTLRFKGDFTDARFSRDTLRLCRDTGFKGFSNFTLRRDSLCLSAGPAGKIVCMARAK